MAKRIFELARELDVTSKVVLTKCRAEGLDIKNHMSTLSAGLEATICEWFSDSADQHTAVETSEHVDLEEARAAAKKARRRRKKKDEPADIEVKPVDESEAALAEAPAAEVDASLQSAPGVEVESPAEQPAEPAELVAAGTDETQVPEATEELPQVESEEEAEPEEEVKPENVKPAGPQVVPKPAMMKGPRVVRVEKPDYVSRPQRREVAIPIGQDPGTFSSKTTRRGKSLQQSRDEDESDRKGTKRRSPRRRGGRSGDSGGKAHKWRDADLAERSERLAAASGGSLRRRRASVRRAPGMGANTKSGKVEVSAPITIKNLSSATGIKAAEFIKKLMAQGTMATVNQVIDRETAEALVLDYEIDLVITGAESNEDQLLDQLDSRVKGEMTPRAPVVTFLGHVDHGKTSLLDSIRNTEVAGGEAGGITQHIGAYRYDKDDVHVVFLDTPGHEAFTAMRARGANMTDVVVLVVAADDGVMPQTIEAISHAKAAEVPIVVALNKIDLSNANIQRAMGQLAEHGLNPREWGGDVEVIKTSAASGEGVQELLELLSLEAELLELKAEQDAPATGFVIEAEMDPSRGVVARLLVRNGTLKIGDIVLAGKSHGRIRQMKDSKGHTITEAPPSTPVEVSGLDEVPEAGDKFHVLENLERARRVVQERRDAARAQTLASAPAALTLEGLLSQIEASERTELPLIIKADVQGSLEALRGSLEKLGSDEVRVKILQASVGGITVGDVTLAEASDAIIVGFNVVPDASARRQAEASGVEIRLYRVIYDLTEDIRKALEEGLTPEIREETLGRAEVRQTFKVSRVGTIAGCYVTDGTITRNAKLRVIRDSVVIADERTLESLKRFKDDVREVRNDMECGLKIAGYDDVKEGDQLEFYHQVEIARRL